MSEVTVRLVRVAVLGVVGLTAVALGLWTYLRVGLLVGLVGPVLGLSLLVYTGLYVRSIV